MMPFIAPLLFTAQKTPELALQLDANSHFSVEAFQGMRHQSNSKDLYFFRKGVRLSAKGASQSLEVTRSDNYIIVRFVTPNGKADSINDSLELPIVGDKPFIVSYDPTSKHYRLAQ